MPASPSYDTYAYKVISFQLWRIGPRHVWAAGQQSETFDGYLHGCLAALRPFQAQL